MKKFLKFLTFHHLDGQKDLGLLLLRVFVGVMFAYLGTMKLLAGSERWEALGGALSHLGITAYPTFFGFLAAISEFLGGILLALGSFTRLAAFALAGTMVVATVMKLKTDGFPEAGYPMTMLFVMVCFILAGAGKFGLDALLKKK